MLRVRPVISWLGSRPVDEIRRVLRRFRREVALRRSTRPLGELREEDVTSWLENARELRGKRPKFWVSDPVGRQWLRKEPRQSRPFERPVEVVVLHSARALGLPAPESSLCVWQDVTGELHRGIVVRRFTRGVRPERSELSLGGDIIAGVDATYDPSQHGHHTLRRIRVALEHWERERHGAGLLQQFADMVLFDAWVGNSDRHQENWGVLHSPTAARLAPIFDTAACFAVELPDDHLLLADPGTVRLEKYISNCNSGFGDGREDALEAGAGCTGDGRLARVGEQQAMAAEVPTTTGSTRRAVPQERSGRTLASAPAGSRGATPAETTRMAYAKRA